MNPSSSTHRRLAVLLFLSAQLAGSPATGAHPLQALHDEAMDHNPQLEAMRLGWTEALRRIDPADSLPDPMVGVNFMRGSTRLDDYSELEYMASQQLPWFGTRRALRDAKRLEAEAEGFLYLEEIRQTRRKVTAAAWDLWYARQALSLNAEQIDLLASLRDSTQARYESGAGRQSDLLRAQVELAREQKRSGDLRNTEALALTELNRLLGSEPQAPRTVDRLAPPPPLDKPLEDHLARANAYCCTLLAFERRTEAQRAMIAAVKKESAPMFQVFVEARQMNGESGIQAVDTGIAMTVPWAQRKKYRARIDEANTAFDRSLAELDMEILMTQKETHTAYVEAQNAERERALLDEEVLPQIDQLIAASRAAYANGDMPLFELIEAERQRREALLEVAMATAEFAKAVAMLDTLTGPYLQPELDTGLVTEENNPQ